VSTFIELKEQAQQAIRAHIKPMSSDSDHHFEVDHTNYFVDRGAALLAALRVWAEPRQKTDADILALIDSASATTLVNIARGLAQATVLRNSMPACSSKGLLTHLHASCPTHSTSHGRVFNDLSPGEHQKL
jgi:hypothetical protein